MQKTKVFITEDEFIVSENLKNKLVLLGYDVVGVASSGEEALEKLEQNQPDLILMDIMLSGKLDGIETAEIIKNEFDIPLIFLTAYSSSEIYKRAEITEPYAYIIKPFEERELEINISIALYKHKVEKRLKVKQKKLEILNANLDGLIQDRTKELIIKNNVLQNEIETRKEAQNREHIFKQIIEQTENYIVLTNHEGEIEYVNPALLKRAGYTVNEIVGSTPRIFKSGKHSKGFYKKLWNVLLSGKVFEGVFLNRKKNGEEYVVEKTIVPIKDSEGVVTHFVAIGKDVTVKKELDKLLVEAQEEERLRIARELHDGIGQSLTAIKFSVGSIANTKSLESKKMLLEIKKLIDQTTTEVREASFNLMPSILSDYGVCPALKKLVAYMNQNSTMEISCCLSETKKRFSTGIEIGIYRIVQEALNNSVKYANCSEITVELRIEDGNIEVSIRDNGVGFEYDQSSLTYGQGIHNMRNRASLLNAMFDIESAKNKGTLITVLIPVSYE